MSDYYDDDEGVYRMRYRQGSPVRYVEPRASYLVPERERRPRSRSRDRFRVGVRPQSPSVIINNSVYNELSDEEDDTPVRLALAAHRRVPSRGRAGPLMTREEMEFEQTMNELRELRLEAQKRKEAEDAEAKKKVDEAQRALEEYHDLKQNAQKQKQADTERDMREMLELRRDAEKKKHAETERDMREMMELRQEAKKKKEAEEEKEKREMMALREDAKKRKQERDEKEKKEFEELVAFRKEIKKKEEAAEAKEREALKEAKRQLDEIRKKEAQKVEEDRLRRELEFKRMKQAEMEAVAKEEREKEIKTALETYRVKEMDRIAKEEKEKEEANKEIERRLQKQLIEAGLPENQIAAILKGERAATEVTVYHQHQSPVPVQVPVPVASPRPSTYTRVARRHVSFETLRTFDLDYDLDPADPDFILIKRWVPEEEQDSLWKHTRYIREKRRVLMVEDKKHHKHRHDPEFEWVRRSGSSRRARSRSPSLLMYLAGAR